MREYEASFILKPDLDDEGKEKIVERIKNVITDYDGEIIEEDVWGERSLAYEIDDYRSGYYTIITFQTENTDLIDELKRIFRIMENVMRHLVIKKDD
ncbi:MAG: 30S ribosomal protein S6 [Bacillota bacterium]